MSPMKKGMLPIFLILAALFADIAIAFPAGQTFFHVPPPHVQVPVAQQAIACQTAVDSSPRPSISFRLRYRSVHSEYESSVVDNSLKEKRLPLSKEYDLAFCRIDSPARSLLVESSLAAQVSNTERHRTHSLFHDFIVCARQHL